MLTSFLFLLLFAFFFFFFSSRRRHTRFDCDWSSDVCSSDLAPAVGAYFEAHIEQGPVLENHERVIGVVSAALGQRWYDVSVQGMEAHAGPTPMELRHDALLAASRASWRSSDRKSTRLNSSHSQISYAV